MIACATAMIARCFPCRGPGDGRALRDMYPWCARPLRRVGSAPPARSDCPCGFCRSIASPRTFVVAWGHAGPRRQTGRGLKPYHINANLRHDEFCPALVDSGNGVQEFDGVGKAPQGVTPSSCKTPRAGGSLVWQRVACHKRDRSPKAVTLNITYGVPRLCVFSAGCLSPML